MLPRADAPSRPASGGRRTAGHFFELSYDDFFEHFNIGAMAAVRCVRAPLLRKAEWARIVNVSAHSTKRQAPGLVSYTAAKSALTSISKKRFPHAVRRVPLAALAVR